MNFEQLNLLIKLGRDFGHAQIRDAGFSDTEHAICAFLCFHDAVSQDFIANALLLDKTTVAKALNAMQRKGTIIRSQNENNRRENIIRLSNAGRASVNASIGIYDAWLADISACLSDEEVRQMDSFVARMINRAVSQREQLQEKSNEKDCLHNG
jgi:DNA-binding MarR family transcriptional regulator